jgi:hypothetical protein
MKFQVSNSKEFLSLWNVQLSDILGDISRLVDGELSIKINSEEQIDQGYFSTRSSVEMGTKRRK